MNLRPLIILAFALAGGAEAATPVPPAAPEPAVLPTGRVLDPVVCRADASQSYALYLPTSLDPARPAPVIFCFEPGARGHLPVERFQAGAEKFGYIVAGSNNARNGQFEPQRVAVEAMLNDVFARFTIDRRRIVLTGMSGGSRLATTVAEATGGVWAVIACGGGFPRGRKPGYVPYAFVGIAGVDDFNFWEMRRTNAALAEARVRHRFLTYAGGHEWPPPEVATRALEWLELDVLRRGERDPDAAFVNDFMARLVTIADTLSPADRLVEWRAIVADFHGLGDVAPVRARLEVLANSQPGILAARAEREEEEDQAQAMTELWRLVKKEDFSAVRRHAARWQKAAETKNDSSARRVARRVVGDAVAFGRQGGQDALGHGLYVDAIHGLELCVAFLPDRAPLLVDLARAYAGADNRRRTLAVLRQAVGKGYADAAWLEAVSEFRDLRDDAAFRAIVMAARNNGRR